MNDSTNSNQAAARALDMAIEIAGRAPKHQSQYTTSARVPWRCINELRAALDELGIAWRREK